MEAAGDDTRRVLFLEHFILNKNPVRRKRGKRAVLGVVCGGGGAGPPNVISFPLPYPFRERKVYIDNLLVRLH